MSKVLAFFFLFLLLSGCAHSTIVPFQTPGADKPKLYPPTVPETVGIYRATCPFTSFIELGLISYRFPDLDLVSMYHQIRKDAAAYGAQAVVDVKTSQETHTEWVSREDCKTETQCGADGACTSGNVCHTEQIPENVTTFLIVGSMIREKK